MLVPLERGGVSKGRLPPGQVGVPDVQAGRSPCSRVGGAGAERLRPALRSISERTGGAATAWLSRVWNSSRRLRVGFVTTLGSAVWLAGLMPIARLMTARLKILCSSAWYFTTDRGWPPVVTSLTQAWIMAGLIRRTGTVPNRGRKCLSR